MLMLESFAKHEKIVFAVLIGLEVETVLLNFFKGDGIYIKFAFSVLNGAIGWERMLHLLPVGSRE